MNDQRDGGALAMASASCTRCHGYGLRSSRGDSMTVCECVYRHIFRASLARYHIENQRMGQESCSSCVEVSGHGYIQGNKSAEYCADFCVVAKHSLTVEQWRIFELHILDEREWSECATPEHRGTFFSRIYKIQQVVGAAISKAQMFPFAGYFGGRFIQDDQIAKRAELRATINKAKRNPWNRPFCSGYALGLPMQG